MELSKIKVVTIIAHIELKDEIIEILEDSMITGYTYFEVFGRSHADGSEAAKNVKFKILLSELISASLMRVLAKRYFDRSGLILFQQDAMIIRTEKFERLHPRSEKPRESN